MPLCGRQVNFWTGKNWQKTNSWHPLKHHAWFSCNHGKMIRELFHGLYGFIFGSWIWLPKKDQPGISDYSCCHIARPCGSIECHNLIIVELFSAIWSSSLFILPYVFKAFLADQCAITLIEQIWLRIDFRYCIQFGFLRSFINQESSSSNVSLFLSMQSIRSVKVGCGLIKAI